MCRTGFSGLFRRGGHQEEEVAAALLLRESAVHGEVIQEALRHQHAVAVLTVVGGFTGQSQALRLAIARALVKINAEDKAALRAEGFMTRDPRSVERKKPGQPKARRRFQFSKR